MVRNGGLEYPGRAIKTSEYRHMVNYESDGWPIGDIDLHMLRSLSTAKEYMMEDKDDPAVIPFYRQNYSLNFWV